MKVTPKGIALYPYLAQPDTKYNEDGEYRLKLKLADADAAALVAYINGERQKSVNKAANDLVKEGKAATVQAALKKVKEADPPYSIETDDDGNPTGYTLFTFKSKAKIKSKKTGKVLEIRPNVFDAFKRLLDPVPPVWTGSEVKVAFSAVPWFTARLGAGVKLQLDAVQIITLVSGGNSRKSASDFGFSEEDGDDLGQTAAETSDDAEETGGDF